MSKRTFWLGIALLVGGVLLLPCLFLGIIAIVNGLATGNSRLAVTGAGFAGGAVVVGGLLWWVVRRQRPSVGASEAD